MKMFTHTHDTRPKSGAGRRTLKRASAWTGADEGAVALLVHPDLARAVAEHVKVAVHVGSAVECPGPQKKVNFAAKLQKNNYLTL